MELEFTTTVDLDIVGSHKELPGSGKIDVSWQIEFNTTPEGVNAMSVIVPLQEHTVSVTRYDPETDEERDETITVELAYENVKICNAAYCGMDNFIPKKLELYNGQASLVF